MKILVMGTGGLGGCFGGRLAAAGNEVTFVARGRQLEALRSGGLRILGEDAPLHLQPIRATSDPRDAGIVDFVMIAVKLWDLEEAARAILPAVGPGTMVASFQNGIDAAETLGGIAGRERVLGGVAYVSAAIEKPGVVRQTGKVQRMIVGELNGGVTPRAAALAEVLKGAGIEAEASADIRLAIWEKFVFLVGMSAATSAVRSPIGPIRADAGARSLLRELMAEAADVGRAGGVAIPAGFAEERMRFIDGLPGGMVASMYEDLKAGRRLELPWLSGAVVRLGEKLGVPTPANGFAVKALALHAGGARR